MNVLRRTNSDIATGILLGQRLAATRNRIENPIRAIDDVLSELEEFHLAGRKRVPEAFEPRLHQLVADLPGGQSLEVRSRVTISHLMDRLYLIQESLLRQKLGGRELEEAGG